MFRNLPRYDHYAPNDSPWLDELPSHWRTQRTKSLLVERSQKGYPDEPLLAATQSHGVILKSDYGTRTVTATKDLHLLKLVEVGDFVISLRSFQGGIERCHHRGIISPAYTVLAAKSAGYREYLTYLFKSRPFVDSLTLSVTGIREGQNIDYATLAVDQLPVPTCEEQAAIVKYLAHANARIDEAIAAKRRLMSLVEERRRALNLEILEGRAGIADKSMAWPIKRLKWITRLQRGYDLPADARHPGPFQVISSGGIIASHRDYRATGPGVVLGRYGSTDAVFYVEGDFWPHNTALFVTDFQGNDPRWCYWLLRSIDKHAYAEKSAVPGVDRKDLYEIEVSVPPVAVQCVLVQVIEKEGVEMDSLMNRCREEISLLTEFRNRLVADVVTGQVDVRAVAAGLPDAPGAVIDLADEFGEALSEVVDGADA